MASLSDEQLHDLIGKLNLDGVKGLLKKAGLTVGSGVLK